MELEAAVHLADEVAVVQHRAHLLGLGAAKAADQLLLAPLQQLLVRHLGQVLGRGRSATFRRHFGHGGGPAARGTRGASPRSRGRPAAAAGGKGEPGARGVPPAPALGRGERGRPLLAPGSGSWKKGGKGGGKGVEEAGPQAGEQTSPVEKEEKNN